MGEIEKSSFLIHWLCIFSFSLHFGFLCCIQFTHKEWFESESKREKVSQDDTIRSFITVFYRGWEFVCALYRMGSDKSQNIDINKEFFFGDKVKKREAGNEVEETTEQIC